MILNLIKLDLPHRDLLSVSRGVDDDPGLGVIVLDQEVGNVDAVHIVDDQCQCLVLRRSG